VESPAGLHVIEHLRRTYVPLVRRNARTEAILRGLVGMAERPPLAESRGEAALPDGQDVVESMHPAQNGKETSRE
jgi:hypothetical protein